MLDTSEGQTVSRAVSNELELGSIIIAGTTEPCFLLTKGSISLAKTDFIPPAVLEN